MGDLLDKYFKKKKIKNKTRFAFLCQGENLAHKHNRAKEVRKFIQNNSDENELRIFVFYFGDE